MMPTNLGFDCTPLSSMAEPVGSPLSMRARGMSRWGAHAGAALVAIAALAGCGGGDAQPAASSEEGQIRAALRLLGMEYGAYMGTHNGAPPKDEAEMRKHLESRLTELSDYNVKSVGTLLRNGRDGQPLAIVVGRKVEAPETSSYPWAAYEKVGVDGKRLVSDTRGGVYEIEEQEFRQHIPGG
jgi:hypothetical protein